MFRAGQKIGIYTLIKRIGRGGFGEVWLAERRAKFVTTKVAVKLPLEEQVDTDAIKHEAVLWEKASGHPNVLPIIDADEYDGQIVIVSEYAPDGSLEELLQKENLLPVKKAVELAMGILNGLEFLHSRKIIHRDIKPANILLQGEIPRLTDFGISRIMKTTSVTMDMSGTPSYMSPEAFDAKRTIQTDIWSVGVILYRMLTGKLPFSHSNLTDLFGAIVKNEPEAFSDSIPRILQNIVLKALEKNPNERYQNAREMRDNLADFLIAYSQTNLQSKQLPQIQVSSNTKTSFPNSKNYPEEELTKERTQKALNKANQDIYRNWYELAIREQEARIKRIERQKRAEKRANRQLKVSIVFAFLSFLIVLFIGIGYQSILLIYGAFIVFLIVISIGFYISYSTYRNPKKIAKQ